MKRVSWIVVLLVALSLFLVACGGGETEQAAEETTTQQEEVTVAEEPVEEPETAVAEEEAPAAEAPETEESSSEENTEEQSTSETNKEPEQESEEVIEETEIALSDLEFSSLDDLSSYRYDLLMTINGIDESGVEVAQTMKMVLAVSSDPPATSMSMITEGQDELEGMGNIEFVQVEDTSYIVMGEMGCMALPAEDDSVMSTDELTEGFTPESLTEDLDKVTLVGEETINGIETLHYTYDELSLTEEEMVGIESMLGHIYLAKDGGYMVRSIIDVVGASEFLEGTATEGSTHIEMNLLDVNQAIDIVPPASCEGQDSAANSEWPVLEDAADVASFAGMVSYTTGTSAEDAIEFYKNTLADLGYTWDEASSFITEGTGLLIYTHPDNPNVNITISQDGDTTSVTIFPDE